jgi:cerevisin
MRLHLLAGLCLFAYQTHATVTTSVDSNNDFVVLFNKTGGANPSVDEVLSQIGLSSAHPSITHVFNNSQFSGFVGNLNDSHVSSLNSLDAVSHVEASQYIAPRATEIQGSSPWGLERVSQLSTVSGDTTQLAFKYTYDSATDLGEGVDVYVVDTGVNTAHVVFTGRAKMIYSIDGTDDLSASADQDGHGTHVAGTCCGEIVGAAPRTNIFGVKVLGSDGSGSSTDTVKGIDYVIQYHDSRKNNTDFVASIASMSWGLSGISTAVETAIPGALNAGIHISVAAGNSNTDACTSTPSSTGGSGGNSIAVGSVGTTDVRSSFSNYGSCVDVYAPGEGVISSYINSTTAIKTLSGTSMSTPRKS